MVNKETNLFPGFEPTPFQVVSEDEVRQKKRLDGRKSAPVGDIPAGML